MRIREGTALLAVLVVASVTAWAVAQAARVPDPAARPTMPRYEHIFVIIEENEGFDRIMGHPEWAPEINKLASRYGLASRFYAEVHSSEGNYIAMLGGDTFGIRDDDAFFCKPHTKNEFCPHSDEPHYVDHDISARSLMDQLDRKRLTWKAYMEDIPGAGSLVPRWPTAKYSMGEVPDELYAAKHNGFVHFESVNEEPFPQLMEHLVGFRQLYADLASDSLPNYAHIVPNQCNEMHGRSAQDGAPSDCSKADVAGLIRRGDAEIGMLVGKIVESPVWRDPGNTAIVITFDENDEAARGNGAQGCCGYDPDSQANFGGGHIPTLVITNHGPRHVTDATPYNHYSLLRTTEAAFGIHHYLAQAAAEDKGVVTMSPLFAVK